MRLMKGYGWPPSCFALKAKPRIASFSGDPPEFDWATEGIARYPPPHIRESVRWHQFNTFGPAQFWPLLTNMNVNPSMPRSYQEYVLLLSAHLRTRNELPSPRLVQSEPQYMMSPTPWTKASENSEPRRM